MCNNVGIVLSHESFLECDAAAKGEIFGWHEVQSDMYLVVEEAYQCVILQKDVALQ